MNLNCLYNVVFFVEKGLEVFSVPVRFSDLIDNIDIIFIFIKVKNIPLQKKKNQLPKYD